MHPNVHSSTIFNSLDTDANLISIDRQIDRIWIDMKKLLSYKKIEYGVCIYIYIFIYIYIYIWCVHIYIMKYYSAIKKNEILPFATTWMDLWIIIVK